MIKYKVFVPGIDWGINYSTYKTYFLVRFSEKTRDRRLFIKPGLSPSDLAIWLTYSNTYRDHGKFNKRKSICKDRYIRFNRKPPYSGFWSLYLNGKVISKYESYDIRT